MAKVALDTCEAQLTGLDLNGSATAGGATAEPDEPDFWWRTEPTDHAKDSSKEEPSADEGPTTPVEERLLAMFLERLVALGFLTFWLLNVPPERTVRIRGTGIDKALSVMTVTGNFACVRAAGQAARRGSHPRRER